LGRDRDRVREGLTKSSNFIRALGPAPPGYNLSQLLTELSEKKNVKSTIITLSSHQSVSCRGAENETEGGGGDGSLALGGKNQV